jgi:putative transposase
MRRAQVKKDDLRRGRSVVSMLHAHLVFVTKYRRNILTGEVLRRVEIVAQGVCADFDVLLKEFNGERDHVHLLIEYPPTVQLSKLVNSLKGVTSRKVRDEFPALKTKIEDALWSPSYFVGSVGGAPISVLRQYIENQYTPN